MDRAGSVTAPLSPILSWGLFVGLLAVVWLSLGEPALTTYRQAGSEVERLRTLTKRQRALIDQQDDYEAALVEARSRYERVSNALLDNRNGQASSAFQAEVRALAARAGLSLGQIAVEPEAEDGAYRKLSLRVRAEGKLAQIHQFLRESHNNRPLLEIAELKISRASGSLSGQQKLRLDFLVIALSSKPAFARTQ